MDVDVLNVLIFPNSSLRSVSNNIEEIGYEEFKLVEDMFETMYSSNGIGLAANQVGFNKRIIVVDVPDFSKDTIQASDIKTSGKYEFINPKIIEHGAVKDYIDEACLSIPGFHDKVERWKYIIVEGKDRHGNIIKLHAAGLLAACIQHEIDHLNGKLFFDYSSKLKRDIAIAKLRKSRRILKLKNASSL